MNDDVRRAAVMGIGFILFRYVVYSFFFFIYIRKIYGTGMRDACLFIKYRRSSRINIRILRTYGFIIRSDVRKYFSDVSSIIKQIVLQIEYSRRICLFWLNGNTFFFFAYPFVVLHFFFSFFEISELFILQTLLLFNFGRKLHTKIDLVFWGREFYVVCESRLRLFEGFN